MGFLIISILAILSLCGLTVFIGVDEATNYTLYGSYNEKDIKEFKKYQKNIVIIMTQMFLDLTT